MMLSAASLSALKKDMQFLNHTVKRMSTLKRELEVEDTTHSLRDLMRTRKNHGDSLLKIGIAMIICPDPVTTAAGFPVAAAGKIMSMRASLSIKDVVAEINRSNSSLSSLRFD